MSSPPANLWLLASVSSEISPEPYKRSPTASDWVDSENCNSTKMYRTGIDWTQLPPELLEKIAGALDEIADRIRFGAVCKPWLSASKSTHLLRVRLPWLLLEHPNRLNFRRFSSVNDDEVQSFLSLSDNRIYKLHLLPGTCKKRYYASPCGWLLIHDDSTRKAQLSLLNPITKAQIHFPPLTAKIDRCKLIATSDALIVMAVTSAFRLVYCCLHRKGADKAAKWTKLRVVDDKGKFCGACDFTYYGGHYFVLGEHGSPTMIFDADTGQLISVIPSPVHLSSMCNCRCFSHRSQYLVESPCGEELFLVFRLRTGLDRFKGFEVFELKRIEKHTKWTLSKVRSIGRNVLFVDDQRAIHLPASDLDGCRGNCVVSYNYYFSPETGTWTRNIVPFRLFDIGNGRESRLPSSWHEILNGWANQGWFVPSL